MALQNVPVFELYNYATICPLSTEHRITDEIRIPTKKTITRSGLPVLALYKASTKDFIVYIMITKEPHGVLFQHYYYEADIVHVSDEDFALSPEEFKDIETFLSNGSSTDKRDA